MKPTMLKMPKKVTKAQRNLMRDLLRSESINTAERWLRSVNLPNKYFYPVYYFDIRKMAIKEIVKMDETYNLDRATLYLRREKAYELIYLEYLNTKDKNEDEKT